MSRPRTSTTTPWLIALLVAANSAFILRDALTDGIASADGPGGSGKIEDLVPGDVNADGVVDMKDAVDVVDHLVNGRPLPDPRAGPGGDVEPVLTREHLEILSHMRIVHLEDGEGNRTTTIRFEGCNVQIVSGLGATNGDAREPDGVGERISNGLGNLIVGYQELRGDGTDLRTGSHNLVIGSENNYEGCGGLVAGKRNEIQGPYSTVTGGTDNRAIAPYASVSGGEQNVASGPSSSVSGGRDNRARGFDTSVSGGLSNIADGISASVSAGFRNHARGNAASIAGGSSNLADGDYAAVSGGLDNRSDGVGAVVSGGYDNYARGDGSSIGGGTGERTRSAYEHQPDHADEMEEAIELARKEERLRPRTN